jgi:hypothetical protein
VPILTPKAVDRCSQTPPALFLGGEAIDPTSQPEISRIALGKRDSGRFRRWSRLVRAGYFGFAFFRYAVTGRGDAAGPSTPPSRGTWVTTTQIAPSTEAQNLPPVIATGEPPSNSGNCTYSPPDRRLRDARARLRHGDGVPVMRNDEVG